MTAMPGAFDVETAAERAYKIMSMLSTGEIGPGLPPGWRFDFTPALAGDVPPGYFRPVGEPFTVRKLSSVIKVPDELLMDYGLIPDTRPKPPPPSWRTRLRRKLGAWREQAARRAYRIVAGYWPDNGEDDWLAGHRGRVSLS